MSASLSLGNVSVVEINKTEGEDSEGNPTVTEEVVERSDLGNRVTDVSFPDDLDFTGQLAAVDALWPSHSDDSPEWVESDDELLAQAVARRFTTEDHECVVGRPSGWQEG